MNLPASEMLFLAGPCPKLFKWFALFVGLLGIAFVKPLFDLVGYSLHTELHSHALLIPFISVYLVWLKRAEVVPAPSSSPALAIIPLAFGLMALNGFLFPDR